MHGQEITDWRKDRQLRQSTLADAIGVSLRTLQRAEKSEDVPQDLAHDFKKLRNRMALREARNIINEVLNDD